MVTLAIFILRQMLSVGQLKISLPGQPELHSVLEAVFRHVRERVGTDRPGRGSESPVHGSHEASGR